MQQTYRVAGMNCAGCATAVTRAIQRHDPTLTIAVDVAGGRVTVTGAATAAMLEAAVTDAGFTFAGVAAAGS